MTAKKGKKHIDQHDPAVEIKDIQVITKKY